ncbi:TPA: Ig domain-containing protein [Staphylococcus aureus]|uniref:Ig-like domain-containing protein n=1 Tax=Staphylococcus aureus TaxID=1280 RepID=UPI001E35F189|nr:Ig-like domain-containing protein [Staphylococcus aureus]UFA57539.1 Ig-like domain-containing protein [Staphylococcus aureus]HDD0308535.1 Ig domain-containing protein [Staphylococcus aureus]HDD0312039.1 Ig domain-containing protein [Staphylococcus aureus]HDD0314864.1 Ig domain-containing protein [Staphylococcus aureus]HDD0316850.1 Ig domain-containing protein [Staphylococcus aureus]
MVRTLKVYKDDTVVASEQGEGKVSITLSNLEADTTYPKGTYQVSWEKDGKESSTIDVPEFKTKPILVTGLSFVPDYKTLKVGSSDTVEPNIAPSTATNKTLKYTSEHPEFVTVDENTGVIQGVAEGTSIITATSTDGSDKSGQITVTVSNE